MNLLATTFYSKRSLTVLYGLLLALALVVCAIPIASAASGSIGGKPAHPDASNPRTKSIFVKTVEPGKTVTDAVEVINSTGEPKTVEVYGTDSVASSGGAFACAQAVETAASVGRWISLQQTTVTVPANESVVVPFTIGVPQDAEPGEQNGCLVIQEKKDPTFQGGIGISFRTAIRVAVLVPGVIHKELTASGLAVAVKGTKVVISPEVKNTGNVSVDVDVYTSLRSLFGQTITTEKNTFPVLRNQVSQWNIESEKPYWGGFYLASYSLTFDNSQSFIGESTIPAMTKTVSGPTRLVFTLPDASATLTEVIVLLLIVGAIVYITKKRNTRVARKEWVSHQVGATEQLQDIAKRHHTSWKKLAEVNSIPAPYTLKAGQAIQVPSAKKATKRISVRREK